MEAIWGNAAARRDQTGTLVSVSEKFERSTEWGIQVLRHKQYSKQNSKRWVLNNNNIGFDALLESPFAFQNSF